MLLLKVSISVGRRTPKVVTKPIKTALVKVAVNRTNNAHGPSLGWRFDRLRLNMAVLVLI